MADPIVRTVTVPSMDFRGNKFVNEDGTLSEVGQSFFDLLHQFLVKNVGEEGLVAPTQTTADRTIIQNNQSISDTGITYHTCAAGTFLYDNETNKVYVAVQTAVGSGIPIFKEVSLI